MKKRKKTIVIFTVIALAMVGIVFMIAALAISCGRDRRDELVFYLYVGPEKITYPGFRGKAQADEMVSSGEIRLVCELQNFDVGKEYTLTYGEEKNHYLYIKYGVKGEDQLLDFNTDDLDMYVEITEEIEDKSYRLRSDKFDVFQKGKYYISCHVVYNHEIYQGFGATYRIVVE